MRDTRLTTTIKKSVALLHTNDKQAEKEIRKTSTLTIATNIKYLGGNSNKQVKDLYDKNFKSLKKRFKKITENEKISHVLG